MNKIETHYVGLVMGETAKSGIILENKCKLDNSYRAVTGIDVETFYTNDTTGAVVEANRSTLVTVRDNDIAVIVDAVDNKLNHSTDLPADQRFLEIEVESTGNTLDVSFRAAHNAWKEGHTFHTYVTLRYEN